MNCSGGFVDISNASSRPVHRRTVRCVVRQDEGLDTRFEFVKGREGPVVIRETASRPGGYPSWPETDYISISVIPDAHRSALARKEGAPIFFFTGGFGFMRGGGAVSVTSWIRPRPRWILPAKHALNGFDGSPPDTFARMCFRT